MTLKEDTSLTQDASKNQADRPFSRLPVRSTSRILLKMRNTAWLWFAGCIAWTVDGIVSLRLHSIQHAQLAFMVALVFLAAGFFYRAQKR
jgi:hypothetical protein